MGPELYDELFQAGALSPHAWSLMGHRLQVAADILFTQSRNPKVEVAPGVPAISADRVSLVIPATYLYALAIENCLKAIIISAQPDRVVGNKLKRWPSDGHDLVCLAELASVTLTDSERELFARLTSFTRWAGRYPVPFAAKDMATQQIGDFGKFPPFPLQGESERTIAAGVVSRLRSLIPSQ